MSNQCNVHLKLKKKKPIAIFKYNVSKIFKNLIKEGKDVGLGKTKFLERGAMANPSPRTVLDREGT